MTLNYNENLRRMTNPNIGNRSYQPMAQFNMRFGPNYTATNVPGQIHLPNRAVPYSNTLGSNRLHCSDIYYACDNTSPSFVGTYPGVPYKQIIDIRPANSTSLKTKSSKMLPVRIIGDVVLKDIKRELFVGAAGAVRFFLLGKQIKHSESCIDMENPGPEQSFFINEDNGMPSELPLLTHNGVEYYGPAAVLRYLTKKMGEYGSDVRRDFVADVVADKVGAWRGVLDDAIASFVKADSDMTWSSYISHRNSLYLQFDKLLTRFHDTGESGAGPFFTGSIPVMCDYLLFSVIYDDRRLFENINRGESPMKEADVLDQCGKISVLYRTLETHPQISEFIITYQKHPKSTSAQDISGDALTDMPQDAYEGECSGNATERRANGIDEGASDHEFACNTAMQGNSFLYPRKQEGTESGHVPHNDFPSHSYTPQPMTYRTGCYSLSGQGAPLNKLENQYINGRFNYPVHLAMQAKLVPGLRYMNPYYMGPHMNTPPVNFGSQSVRPYNNSWYSTNTGSYFPRVTTADNTAGPYMLMGSHTNPAEGGNVNRVYNPISRNVSENEETSNVADDVPYELQ